MILEVSWDNLRTLFVGFHNSMVTFLGSCVKWSSYPTRNGCREKNIHLRHVYLIKCRPTVIEEPWSTMDYNAGDSPTLERHTEILQDCTLLLRIQWLGLITWTSNGCHFFFFGWIGEFCFKRGWWQCQHGFNLYKHVTTWLGLVWGGSTYLELIVRMSNPPWPSQ